MQIDRASMQRERSLARMAAAIAMAVLIQVCVRGTADAQEGSVTVRNPAMPGETLVGHVDQEVQVQLESRPGTGYVWDLANSPAGLEFLGSDTETLSGSAGGSALQVFRFKPAVVGEFRLDFVLQRPWEGDPIDHQTVRIRVGR